MDRLPLLRHLVPAALLVVLVGGVFVGARSSAAQPSFPETKEIYLYDVPIGDGFIISVPFTWMHYRGENYATTNDAEAALTRFYGEVAPGRQSYTTAVPFIALRPELINDDFVQVVMPLLMPLEDFGITEADETTVEQIAQALSGVDTPRIVEINGRPAAVAFRDAALSSGSEIFYVFPEEGMLASVIFAQPTCCPAYVPPQIEFLMAVVAVSFRREGEAFDIEGWQAFLETSESFPREFILAGMLPGLEATAEATPEAAPTEAAPSTTPAAEEPEVTETPSPDATSEVNEETACMVSSNTRINIRSGPGTSFAVLGRLIPGETAVVYGQALGEDGLYWWQLLNGAWVRSDVVNENDNCDSVPVVPGF